MSEKNELINSEDELYSRINNLDKIANNQLMKIKNLHIEDLFFISAVDKSIKLIDTFLFAFDRKNITVLATLTRLQMDCLIRAFSITLVDNSTEFCEKVLIKNIPINKLKDIDNKKMTDKYLCEKIEEYLNFPMYDIYKKTCDFVHFSPASFQTIAKAEKQHKISLYISRKNREEYESEFERISIELANLFLYFGNTLIERLVPFYIDKLNDNIHNKK